MRYVAAAFVVGFCLGWFMRRRTKGGNDLPPLAVVVIYLFTQFMAAAGGGGVGVRPLLDAVRVPVRRAWLLERDVCECRRHAFSGYVGEDTRTLKTFLAFLRTRWDAGAGGATSCAALRWLHERRDRRRFAAKSARPR